VDDQPREAAFRYVQRTPGSHLGVPLYSSVEPCLPQEKSRSQPSRSREDIRRCGTACSNIRGRLHKDGDSRYTPRRAGRSAGTSAGAGAGAGLEEEEEDRFQG